MEIEGRMPLPDEPDLFSTPDGSTLEPLDADRGNVAGTTTTCPVSD